MKTDNKIKTAGERGQEGGQPDVDKWTNSNLSRAGKDQPCTSPATSGYKELEELKDMCSRLGKGIDEICIPVKDKKQLEKAIAQAEARGREKGREEGMDMVRLMFLGIGNHEAVRDIDRLKENDLSLEKNRSNKEK